jgi:hypothetical protein
VPLLVSSFETHEHIQIGNNVKLPSGASGGDTVFTFENGNAQLNYGDVVALAGDFYAIPDKPISDATDTVQAFKNVFRTLVAEPDTVVKPDPGFAPSRLYKYQSRVIIHGPMETVESVLQEVKDKGEQPSAAYDLLGASLDQRWNKITGGGSDHSGWYPEGRYLLGAENNWDHFTFDGRAWTSYSAGHRLALEAAERVFQSRAGNFSNLNPQEDLSPFMHEAFAQHFLTDMFSSGHMRTPRKKFHETVSPSQLGDYLSKYMHDEDCKFGLNVTNKRGDRWTAYGDRKYLDDVNAAARAIIKECVQAAVDEVAGVMATGRVGGTLVSDLSADEYAAARYVPIVDEDASFTPMFKWDGSQLLRRKDLRNLRDTHFKKHGGAYGWWPGTTVYQLGKIYGGAWDLPPMPNSTLNNSLEVERRWRLQQELNHA